MDILGASFLSKVQVKIALVSYKLVSYKKKACIRAKIYHVGVDHNCFPCGLLNPYTDPVLMLNVLCVL